MHFELLFTQAELFNDISVTLNIGLLQIVQEISSLTNKLQQTLTGVEVFFVGLKVTGQLKNTSGQKRDLHFWGTRIIFVLAILNNNFFLFRGIHNHSTILQRQYSCLLAKLPLLIPQPPNNSPNLFALRNCRFSKGDGSAVV